MKAVVFFNRTEAAVLSNFSLTELSYNDKISRIPIISVFLLTFWTHDL